MAQISYDFKVSLVQTLDNLENPLPTSVLSLSPKDFDDNVEKIRNKIYDLFSINQDLNAHLEWIKKYMIYFEDGKLLDLNNKFSIFVDKSLKELPSLYFSSISFNEFLEKKMKQQEKLVREVILNSLKKSLKDLMTFDQVITPKFKMLVTRQPELNVPVYKFNALQSQKLDEKVRSLEEDISFMEFISEIDREDAIADSIKISLLMLKLEEPKQYEMLKLHHQFSIKPNFPYSGAGIERIADLGIYDGSFDKVICLNEIKNTESDLEECIRQNADQLRAYCLCYNKKIGRGIATTGEKWLFTQYNKTSEEFQISKAYQFFKKRYGIGPIFEINDNYKEFFESLTGFIQESFGIINNN